MSKVPLKSIQTDINQEVIYHLKVQALKFKQGLGEVLFDLVKQGMRDKWEERPDFLCNRVLIGGIPLVIQENTKRQNVYLDDETIGLLTQRAYSLGFSVRQDYLRLLIAFGCRHMKEVLPIRTVAGQ